MGVIDKLARLSAAGKGLGQAVVRGRAAVAAQDAHEASLGAMADRYVTRPTPGFRSFLHSIDSLPGPVAVVATTAMVGFALLDPAAFATRMNGLNEVPEPLWWLAGGLVSVYFGAREMRFARGRAVVEAMAASVAPVPVAGGEPAPDTGDFADNPALRDWAALRG